MRPEDDEIKRAARDSFARAAPAYVSSDTHAKGDDLARLVELAAPRAGELALDVATGGGHTARALARQGARVFASDLTLGMLRAARAAAPGGQGAVLGWAGADAEALPFRAGAFAIVSCRIAPHHFPSVPRFLAEVARVLAPSGRFALEDSVAPEDEEAARVLERAERLHDPTHVRTLSESEWVSAVEAAGLRVERRERHRKRHVLDEWCPRPGMSDEARAGLERVLAQGSPRTLDELHVELAGGRPVAFADEKIVLLATKR